MYVPAGKKKRGDGRGWKTTRDTMSTSVARRGDALHAVPVTLCSILCGFSCAQGAYFFLGVAHSQPILVERRGALPAAGPVACGGLWVMTAVDRSSSSAAVICAAHIAMVFIRNQSWLSLIHI